VERGRYGAPFSFARQGRLRNGAERRGQAAGSSTLAFPASSTLARRPGRKSIPPPPAAKWISPSAPSVSRAAAAFFFHAAKSPSSARRPTRRPTLAGCFLGTATQEPARPRRGLSAGP